MTSVRMHNLDLLHCFCEGIILARIYIARCLSESRKGWEKYPSDGLKAQVHQYGSEIWLPKIFHVFNHFFPLGIPNYTQFLRQSQNPPHLSRSMPSGHAWLLPPSLPLPSFQPGNFRPPDHPALVLLMGICSMDKRTFSIKPNW